MTAPTSPAETPTARRLLAASNLRRLREQAGVSMEAAGEAIRASQSKISRLERGRVGLRERDVVDLLTLYGVTDTAIRDALLDMVRESKAPAWWDRYSELLPTWFLSYVSMEQSATKIVTNEIMFVPGLLQTREYARAVISSGDDMDDTLVDQWVTLRMQRQARLDDENNHLHAFIDEAVLSRTIGSDQLMAAQLDHLADMSRRPNITIQIIPMEVDGWIGQSGPFVYLDFPDPDIPDIVYLEQLVGAFFVERPKDVAEYRRIIDRMATRAMSARRSRALLREMKDRYRM